MSSTAMETSTSSDRLVVLAGTKREADEWRRQKGLRAKEVHYIGGPRSAVGISRPRVVILPGFQQHREHEKIWAYFTWKGFTDVTEDYR